MFFTSDSNETGNQSFTIIYCLSEGELLLNGGTHVHLDPKSSKLNYLQGKCFYNCHCSILESFIYWCALIYLPLRKIVGAKDSSPHRALWDCFLNVYWNNRWFSYPWKRLWFWPPFQDRLHRPRSSFSVSSSPAAFWAPSPECPPLCRCETNLGTKSLY